MCTQNNMESEESLFEPLHVTSVDLDEPVQPHFKLRNSK